MTEVENAFRARWGLALDDGGETAAEGDEEREQTPRERAAQIVRDVQAAEPAQVAPPEQPVELEDTQAAALPDPGSQAALKQRLRKLLARA